MKGFRSEVADHHRKQQVYWVVHWFVGLMPCLFALVCGLCILEAVMKLCVTVLSPPSLNIQTLVFTSPQGSRHEGGGLCFDGTVFPWTNRFDYFCSFGSGSSRHYKLCCSAWTLKNLSMYIPKDCVIIKHVISNPYEFEERQWQIRSLPHTL